MNHTDLRRLLDALQKICEADASQSIQAVAGILAVTIASMHSGTEKQLLGHICRFAEDQLKQIDSRN